VELVGGTDLGRGRARRIEHGRDGRRKSGSERAPSASARCAVHGCDRGAARARTGSIPRVEQAGGAAWMSAGSVFY
jgi:hypothetical protein